MSVIVVNRYHAPKEGWPNPVYIGRPSIFGNPYSRNQSKYAVIPSEDPVNQFKEYFYKALELEGLPICKAVRRLVERAQTEEIQLVCTCKPKSCHGDVIAEYVNAQLGTNT
jgi:hypothetical protein